MPALIRTPTETAPPRMGALAKLPIFLDLAGKRALVAGGTAPAAWKAELLAAAGANVVIVADEIGSEMAELVARGAASGSLVTHVRGWTAADFTGVAVAIADIEAADAATAFHAAAVSAGVPVNVIDKPAYCSFQFGSIVNRSPLVIGISTDGAAPILGQAIRRRIETLLPPSLAAWTRMAKSLRWRVAQRLEKGTPRRLFWERFADRAFGPPPQAGDRDGIEHAFAAAASQGSSTGRVTLVGAGPGDAELLTLKAVRALQSADVILYDDLVSDDVLELARREAKRMLVGKRGRRESCRQGDINALMVKLARQGKHVVRLKSGDPMIFGRAGEEIEQLAREGIAVAVVPGITAASAMAAALGVSLTHRDHAQSLRFVTGHARSGHLPDDLDWKGLADPTSTLIVYMGGHTICELATRLLDEGGDPATPVVAVADLARPGEKRHAARLLDVKTNGLDGIIGAGPVLIGIGRVFAHVQIGMGQEEVTTPPFAASQE